MNIGKLHIVCRVIITILVVGYFGYITHQHIPFTGVRTISYTFDRPDGSIGIFRPPVRYELIETGKEGVVAKVLEDPVYFDIKTLVSYRQAHIVFRYQKHTTRTVQLAVKSSLQDKAFATVPFQEQADSDWIVGSADVDLTSASRQNRRYTFALSIPGLVAHTSDDYILVSRMDVRLTR